MGYVGVHPPDYTVDRIDQHLVCPEWMTPVPEITSSQALAPVTVPHSQD